MFITAHRNVIIPLGGKAYPISRGFVGEVPDQVAQTAYFQALVRDGKISIPASKKDHDIADAMDQKLKQAESAASNEKQPEPEQSDAPSDEAPSEDPKETEPESKKTAGRKKKTEE